MLQELNTTELNGAEGIVVNTDCDPRKPNVRFAISIKRPAHLTENYNAGIKVKVGNLIALSNLKRA